MRKTLLPLLIVCSIAGAFYFKKSDRKGEEIAKSNPYPSLNETSKSESQENNSEFDRNLSTDSSETKMQDRELTKDTESASDVKGNVELFYTVLVSEMGSSGYSAGLSSCIELELRKNLGREEPLRIEDISTKCASDSDLPSKEVQKIAKLIRKAMKSSQNPVDIIDWWKCMKDQKAETSSCISAKYEAAAKEFYEEGIVDGNIMPNDEYRKKINAKRDALLQAIIKQCPRKDVAENRILFFNECSKQ